jgi:penicillin-binding protein 1A
MSRRERQQRRRRNHGSPLLRVIGLTGVLLVCALALGGLAIAGWVVNVADSAPDLKTLPAQIPGSPSQVFASDGQSLGYIYSPTLRTPAAGSEIPQALKDATIAVEDRRFWHHGALDYQGILRAAIKDVFSGGGGLQGASTLTMQLVNNVYMPARLKADHDLKYKIIQAKLAEQLEGKHTKVWILDSYLNDVPYGTVGGQTAYGVGAASQIFFDKPVSKLTLAQAALLAGLPQAPSQYNPFLDRGAARQRRAEVLQAMVTADYISQAQANAANRKPLEVRSGGDIYSVHEQPYLFDYVQQQVAKDLCPRSPNNCPALEHGGLKIYTTIDLRKQALAQQAILETESLRVGQNPAGTAAAALASINPANGNIEALATSASYSQTKFFYPTEAHRQPGSSFKVFALMTLIHDYHGDPNSTYYTSKFLPAGWLPEDPTWSVHTAEETYQGTIDITKATIVSDNTVFAQLAADLGWSKLDATAHAMGITSPLDGNPAEVIGGLRIGVTPLEMADAYGTLANGGSHVPTTIIGRVVFPDGSYRNFGEPPHTQVFTDGEAYEATSVLKQVITSGTGTAANYGCPAAGKTGTANALENAWFVGYTPRMSTAVWVGYPQGNLPMADGFGGTLAAPIWHDYMQAASGGYCGDFPPPETPFQGTAFFGHFSATGQASTIPGQTGTSAAQSTTQGGTGGTAPTSTSPYNNPTLFAQPPQTPPGNGNGNGNGNGATTGTGNSPVSPNGGTGVKKH